MQYIKINMKWIMVYVSFLIPILCISAPATPSPGVPEDYSHRPVIEFFTGLSCPSCMNGPHQDMHRLLEENKNVRFTYVEFHELNGGNVDDLATDESKERMRHYQPGVSGTPDAEFDGGYIELGGLYGGELNYESAKQAEADCEKRYENRFNPLHPVASLTEGFKFVRLSIKKVLDASEGFEFTVEVKVEYLGSSAPLDRGPLSGSLYVFMIEDNVSAYSKVLEQNVTNRNVFRGYAIKDERFQINRGDVYTTTGRWKVPTDVKVPIKVQDVDAVAVVYDLEDTSSEKENQGNPTKTPRAIQSATPITTAMDNGKKVPTIREVALQKDESGKIKLTAKVDADNGTVSAFLFYNYEGMNSTEWYSAEMIVEGKECEEEDACIAYKDAIIYADIEKVEGDEIYITIITYDSEMTEGKYISKMFMKFYTTKLKNNEISLSYISAAGVILGVVLLLYMYSRIKKIKS